MGYSRASKNLIYDKMHNTMNKSMSNKTPKKAPTPIQVAKQTYIDRPKKELTKFAANVVKGTAKLGYKIDKATLGRMRK